MLSVERQPREGAVDRERDQLVGERRARGVRERGRQRRRAVGGRASGDARKGGRLLGNRQVLRHGSAAGRGVRDDALRPEQARRIQNRRVERADRRRQLRLHDRGIGLAGKPKPWLPARSRPGRPCWRYSDALPATRREGRTDRPQPRRSPCCSPGKGPASKARQGRQAVLEVLRGRGVGRQWRQIGIRQSRGQRVNRGRRLRGQRGRVEHPGVALLVQRSQLRDDPLPLQLQQLVNGGNSGESC